MDTECYHDFLTATTLFVYLSTVESNILFLGAWVYKSWKKLEHFKSETFLAGIIFSINSTLLLAVRTQEAEILQLSVLWENIVQANLSLPSTAILSQPPGVLTPAINFVNPAEHILWQMINPKQVKWDTQPGYLQSLKMLQARYGHEQCQWPAQPHSIQHPASGTLGLQPKAFSGRLCPAEPKGAESSVPQTQMSLTEGQTVTGLEACLSLSVGQISWDNVILDK